MGLFEDLGERVERFKQEVTDVAEDEAEYECADCGERLYTDHDHCPNCDADAVVPRDLGDGDSRAGGDASTDENATDAEGPTTGDEEDATGDEVDATGDAPGRGEGVASDGSRASDPDAHDATDPDA